MDQDVVNITKIKDGFFLGDEATAANLEVIIQFKITHMVNAAGSQIINAWESIGIKYLTLNWSETPNQNLFDPKDEIANRIVSFIDDSFKNGEGFLVHSVRGQNRACLVVLIYFVKKYRWTLKKAIEFLTNKKSDVDIPNYFLSQLNNFEARLGKLGQGPKSNSWFELATGDLGDIDNEELLIRNTYLNGLVRPQMNTPSKQGEYNYKRSIKCLVWSDQTKERSLILGNTRKDLVLYNSKDIKPVVNHKKMKPKKSCLKSSNGIVQSEDPKMVRNNSSSKLTDKPDYKENNLQYTYNNKFNPDNSTKLASNILSVSPNNPMSEQFVRDFESRQISNISEVKYSNVLNQEAKASNANDRTNPRENPRSFQPTTHSYLRDNSIKKDKYSNYINREVAKEKESRGISNPAYTNDFTSYDRFKSNQMSNNQPSNTNVNRPSRYTSKPYSQVNQPSRPYSVEQKREKKDDDAKIIISPQVQNIVNNNINNIYIQPPDVENFNRIVYNNYNKPGTPNTNPTNPSSLGSTYGGNPNLAKYSDISEDNNYINNPNKLVKNSDNQRVLNNNYFQAIKDPSINMDYSLKIDNSKNFSNNNIYLANLAEVKGAQSSLSQTLNNHNQANKKMPVRPKSVIEIIVGIPEQPVQADGPK